MPTDLTTRTALHGLAAETEASYDPDRTGTPQNAPAGSASSAASFRTAGHEAPTAPATATDGHRPAAGAVGVESPLGLPAALRELLGIAADVDRGIARMIGLLMRLQTSGQVEADTGLPVDHFLAQLGRVTRIDRQFLCTAADVLATMPATFVQFCEGRLSWSQIRAIVTAVRGLRAGQRAQLDDEIAQAALEFATWEPDQIVGRVELLAADLATDDRDDPEELLEPDDRPADVLVLQPRLDGTGGKLYGDYHDPIAFGTIENALNQQMGRPHGLEPSTDQSTRSRNRDRVGKARADALTQICADSLAGHTSDGHTTPAKPLVLASVSLETLLGLSHRPGQLLTSMTGGRLRVDAATVRRLVDESGAALRTIVLDDVGRAVGVGRRTHVPPGWLRDTIRALHATCTAPGCRTSTAHGDLDHVTPFPAGRTDVDNLTPACRRHHRAKHGGTWQVTVLADGTKRWRHTRTGLTVDRPADTRPLTAGPLQPPKPATPDREPAPLGRRRT